VIVVKVGGSLFGDARFGPALKRWIADQTAPVLLIPGGGAFADVVRDADRIHSLGEEASHWLALRSLSVSGALLKELIRPLDTPILDCFDYFRDRDSLPHSWDVTTDTLALKVALDLGATELILLKSTENPAPGDWKRASELGFVDPYFPSLVAETPFPIRSVNFRGLV
jgi:aspartokinase-like uncharacterized kinase